jgi:hypothetical protein
LLNLSAKVYCFAPCCQVTCRANYYHALEGTKKGAQLYSRLEEELKQEMTEALGNGRMPAWFKEQVCEIGM